MILILLSPHPLLQLPPPSLAAQFTVLIYMEIGLLKSFQKLPCFKEEGGKKSVREEKKKERVREKLSVKRQ